MTLNFERHLGRIKMNHHAKYLGQRSRHKHTGWHTDTHGIDCSTWTTKVVGKMFVRGTLTKCCRYLVRRCEQ